MDTCKTIRVKPWGEGQGDFVEINAEDFDPAVHVALDPLDHDGDGHKGGSLPDDDKPDHTHAPADYEVADNSESFTDPHGTHDVGTPPKAAKKRRVAK